MAPASAALRAGGKVRKEQVDLFRLLPVAASVASLSCSLPSPAHALPGSRLILSQAAALCALRPPAAAAGVPEAPRSGLQQTQMHLQRSSSLTTTTVSASSRRRPRAVSAAASSTQVDRDHTAASMDSSRGQALVAWLEVRLEIEGKKRRALHSPFADRAPAPCRPLLLPLLHLSYLSPLSSLSPPSSPPFPQPPLSLPQPIALLPGQRRPAAESRAPRGHPRGETPRRRRRRPILPKRRRYR